MARLLLFLLLLTAVAPTAATAQPGWPASTFNPAPAEDDLVLPMPCGGAMVFRKVETPTGDGALDDRPALLGSADTEAGYIETLRRVNLVGPFGGGRQPRHFFMGKYEVSRAQFDALRLPECPATDTPEARRPAVDISWFEAMDAARSYSTFLLQHARASLPRRGLAPAFVRMPTEAEWEYAARGGAVVSEADFQGRVFPMPEGGPEAYAWFQGSRSAAGRLSSIGLKRPNPLGLHDMLGNAAEWVLDPFRMNRVGRSHGLAGGPVARGGDYRTTTEAQLRSSLRIEYAPYVADTGEPTHLPTIGVRFALAAPTQGSLADSNSFRQAFDAETRVRVPTGDDPVALLQALRREQTDPAMLAAIDRVGAAYAAETRESTDRARLAARAQIQAAAVLARSVYLAEQRALGLQRLVDNSATFGASRQQASNWRQGLADVRTEMEGGLRAYATVVTQLARATDVEVGAEAAVVQQDLRAQRVPDLVGVVALVARHAQTAARSLPPLAVLRTDILREASGR